MLNKRKVALILVPVLMVGLGFWLINSNEDLQKNLAAFVYHIDVVADASDGNAPPDYRFIINHTTPKKVDVKESIEIPEKLKLITESHCKHLIRKLDAGRMIDKFEVAYTILCYDQYPKLFEDFFTTAETKSEKDARLRPAAPETEPAAVPASTEAPATGAPASTPAPAPAPTPAPAPAPAQPAGGSLL